MNIEYDMSYVRMYVWDIYTSIHTQGLVRFNIECGREVSRNILFGPLDLQGPVISLLWANFAALGPKLFNDSHRFVANFLWWPHSHKAALELNRSDNLRPRVKGRKLAGRVKGEGGSCGERAMCEELGDTKWRVGLMMLMMLTATTSRRCPQAGFSHGKTAYKCLWKSETGGRG